MPDSELAMFNQLLSQLTTEAANQYITGKRDWKLFDIARENVLNEYIRVKNERDKHASTISLALEGIRQLKQDLNDLGLPL